MSLRDVRIIFNGTNLILIRLSNNDSEDEEEYAEEDEMHVVDLDTEYNIDQQNNPYAAG